MNFDTPTTKNEMYEILKEIFAYYRLRRPEHDEITLQPLQLERLDYTAPTDAELEETAETALYAQQRREVRKEKQTLGTALRKVRKKLAEADAAAQAKIAAAEEKCEKVKQQLTAEAAEKGLAFSTVIADGLRDAETDLAEETEKINADLSEEKTALSAEMSELQERLDGLDDFYADVHEKEIAAKVDELKKERDALQAECFKYNNGLDEKEQRYANTLTQSKITLELRYLDLSSKEYTKSQLVDLGYYGDVIKCVCAYYDTLTAQEAYNDIKDEAMLAVYLEDYYENIIYMYKNKV